MEYQEAVMKEGILSIDLGTMGVKVTLVTMSGEIQRSAYAEYPIISELPGQAEQDPALWWKGIIDCIKELKSHDACLPKLVNAISICGQMHTHVYLDSEDNPIGPSITWLDQRQRNNRGRNRDGRADTLRTK
jgi:xylulokinase